MPPKSSQGGKPQPTISSFFAKKAVAGPSDARPAQPPTSNSIEPSEPPQKRLKTSEDEDSTTTTASRGKDVRRADRVEQWRYVPPPTTQTAEDQAMSVDALPSSSQRSEDEDNRHQAFRKKLLGSDDPIRRRDRQRDEARQAEEREEGRGNAGEDNSAPIAISEDEDDDLPNTNSLNKFSRNGSANTQTTKSSASKGKAKVKYTPLEQQVLELKAKHPDVLLLFEVGYKFIAYEEDAVNASKELNIACFPKNNLRVASIPVHRIHIHARRLVGSGYKVGVVRQTETRALKAASTNASTPFTRELTELYTASTWVEDLETVNGSRSEISAIAQNSLIAIVERIEGGNYGSDERVSIGLIAVQASTGSVVYDQFVDSSMRSELETRLAHLQPAELLLPPSSSLSKPTERLLRHIAATASTLSHTRVRIERTDGVLKYDDAFNHVSRFYEDMAAQSDEDGSAANTTAKTIDDSQVGQSLAAVMKLPHLAIIALATCLQHLQTFGLTSMFKITSSFTSFQARSEMLLSTGTLYNLELFTTTDGTYKGSLLWLLDKCKTAFGKRTLRKWISRPLTDLERLEERMAAVTALLESSQGKSSPVLSGIPELLVQQPDLEKGLARMIYGRAAPTELATVLLSLNRISHHFESSHTNPSEVGTPSVLLNNCIFALPKVRKVVSEALSSIHLAAARKNEKQEMFKEDKYPQLQDEKDKIAIVEAELQEYLAELKKSLKRPSLQYATVSGMDYLVEVRAADAKKVPADWLRMSATKSMVRFHTPTITRLLKRRDQHKELLAAEASAAYNFFVADLCESSTELRNAIAALGTLDALLSLASVAALPGYIKPEFVQEETSNGGTIQAEGLRHPMSEALREGYVPNDVELGGDTNTRGIILTGANMGGKSSTVRAIALCVILAQIGSYIPATSARLSLHDSVLTRMGASDELAKGRSTFMVEAQEASEILRVSTHRSLVILDELGRGTSTFDGQAIASAILTHLMTRDPSKRPTLLFITHYTALCELASKLPGVRNVHMAFVEHQREDKKEVVFLYKLKDGPASSSFGIHCASLAGLPQALLTQAETKATELRQYTEERVEEKRRLAAYNVLKHAFADDAGAGNSSESKPGSRALGAVKTAVVKLGIEVDMEMDRMVEGA